MIRSPVATSSHPRALAALVAVALAALFLPFAAGPAAAADVQGFEIDGDLVDAPIGGAADWDTRLTAPTLNDQDPSDTTVFSASSKEDDAPSTWTFAGQPPQKDDIGNVYVDTDLVGGDVVLRLAWDRNGTTGTDTYYLELNKSPNASPAIPSRTVGDLRFGIEEQGNGMLALLDASQWTTAGGGSWQSIPLGMSGFAYAVNAGATAIPAGWTSPWAVGSYQAEQFIETTFDLTALIGLQPGCPPAFGTVNFRNATGGGGGLAKNLKDAVGGVEVPAPDTCGTVIVNKDTLPAGSAQTFGLDSTLDSAASTNGGLDGKSISDTSTGSVTALDVQPGAYTLTELVPAGWDFAGVVCVDPDQGTTVAGPVVALDVDEYETVTCTYANTQQAQVVVVKVTDPVSQGGTFEFETDVPGLGTGGTVTINVPADTPAGVSASSPLVSVDPAGSEFLVEEFAPAGWNLVDLVCDDPDGGTTSGFGPTAGAATIDLDPGETVTCTFTNTKLGTITVQKLTLPASDSTSEFAFTSDIPDGEGTFAPTLVNGGSATSEPLVAGDYIVTEATSDADDWILDSIVCTDELGAVVFESVEIDEATATIPLGAAQNVTCVYLNVVESDLTIVKSNDPTGLVPLGSTVTYTLKVGVPEGGGYNQEQVVVTDYIPGYDPAVTGSGTMTYVEGSATCDTGLFPCAVTYDATAKKLTWTIDEIAVGEFRTLTYKATVDTTQAGIPSGQSGTVTLKNVAAMDSLYTDPVKSNEVQNTASIEVAVLAEAIVKTGLSAPLGPIALAGTLLIGTGAGLAFGSRRRSEAGVLLTS
jgi:hypothetical protein